MVLRLSLGLYFRAFLFISTCEGFRVVRVSLGAFFSELFKGFCNPKP